MININYHCDGCNNGIVVMQKHEDNNKGSVKLTSNPCNGCKKDFKLSEASKLSKVSFASSTAEATALKERVLELEDKLKSILYMSENRGVDGCTWGDTDMSSTDVVYGYNLALSYAKEGIELLINKSMLACQKL